MFGCIVVVAGVNAATRQMHTEHDIMKSGRDAYFAIITHGNTLPDMKKCSHRCNPILWLNAVAVVAVMWCGVCVPFCLMVLLFSTLNSHLEHTLIDFLLQYIFFYLNIHSSFDYMLLRFMRICESHVDKLSRGPLKPCKETMEASNSQNSVTFCNLPLI